MFLRWSRALSLVLLFSFAPQDVNKARALMEEALKALQAPAPPTVGALISTQPALDAAIAAAAPNAVLSLSPSLVYTGNLTIKKSITLQSDVPAVRMDTATKLPVFNGGITISADDVTLIGLEVHNTNPLTDIVTLSGIRDTLDRMRILGDPVKGAKRGVAANGNGFTVIKRSYIDDCFQSSPGNDSQAIGFWDMAPGLLIEDNFLRAGSETILIGGSDPIASDRMPRNIVIRNNWITARPEWMGKPIGVKTRFEIKAADTVLVEGNRIEYVWQQGQGGYLVSFTVRNQNGKANWSTIRNVVFKNNEMAHGAGAFNILALDDNQPSLPMSSVNINHNNVSDIDPVKYRGGSNKMIQISGGPTDLTIDSNKFVGTGIGSVVYFYGALASANNLVITNNTWPKSTYGVFGTGAAPGKAWPMFVKSGTFSGNIEIP